MRLTTVITDVECIPRCGGTCRVVYI